MNSIPRHNLKKINIAIKSQAHFLLLPKILCRNYKYMGIEISKTVSAKYALIVNT